MSTPKAVELRAVESGKILTFGSVAQASDYLGRSGTYMKTITFGMEDETVKIKSAWGEEYIVRILGLGCRRDAVQRDHEKEKRKHIPIELRQKFQTQLCTTCARAVGFCDWSDRLQPVEGWTAQQTEFGYRVTGCPLYMKDALSKDQRRKQRKDLLKERREQIELQRSNKDSENDS